MTDDRGTGIGTSVPHSAEVYSYCGVARKP
jgi:hypothetical protein